MDMSEYAEPTPTEIEQVVDEARRDVGLGPVPRPAAGGVADMQARIEYHTDLLARLRTQPPSDQVQHFIRTSERQLAEAQRLLAQYQHKLTGLN